MFSRHPVEQVEHIKIDTARTRTIKASYIENYSIERERERERERGTVSYRTAGCRNCGTMQEYCDIRTVVAMATLEYTGHVKHLC